MARRRSARLASASNVSDQVNKQHSQNSHVSDHKRNAGQAASASKISAAPNLESVAEREESPADKATTTQSLDAVMSSPIRPPPQTPSATSIIKPPMSEMHPSKVHPGTMAAPSSALRLGFTDIKPKTTTSASGVGAQPSTPSKSNAPSSPLKFQFARNTTNATAADSGLGPDAQRIMAEIRDEAARIKADLAAQREQERLDEAQVNARKIAHPKGKAGRYSAVHMADFKKMDSIENHPSAFRATPGRSTPAAGSVKGIKRSQSKANLNDSESSQVKTPVKIHSLKSSKKTQTPGKGAGSIAKRTKQHVDDDASTNRPLSQDGSNIPRPKTPGKDSRGIPRAKSLANLMSPTHASLARVTSIKTPSAPRSLLKTPSKVALTGLKKSATVSNLGFRDVEMKDAAPKVQTPSRLDRIKSMFAKHVSATPAPKPSIPRPALGASKTPAPVRAQHELPPAPLTTPGKKITQHGDFTPAPKHAALAQNSPSPVKTGIPRSKPVNGVVNYPSLGMVIEGAAGDAVSYPDLSGARPLPEPPSKSADSSDADAESESQTEPRTEVPGHFTFRSDHTIRFGSDSPNGFGGHSGQASIRQVRPSIAPSMPGAFPFTETPRTTGPRGKENMPPYAQQSFDPKTFAHGMSSKKRHRVEDDEEEEQREAAERAAKKMKSASVPEGDALMAPKLASAQKARVIRSPSKIMRKSPIKSRTPAVADSPAGGHKVGTISRSRLAYLAQPKQRK